MLKLWLEGEDVYKRILQGDGIIFQSFTSKCVYHLKIADKLFKKDNMHEF